MNLSPEGRRVVEDVARSHGFGVEAVTQMLQAVAQGNRTQAQFNHPEFGGMGQWSQGGMIMLGDMFNNALKGRVDALCCELSREMANRTLWAPPPSSQWQSQGGSMPRSQAQSQGGGSGGDVSLFVGGSGMGGSWWPHELGSPAATGSQNDLRYAYFPAARRLAIDLQGRVTVYDTGDHQIGGVAQQQGSGTSFTFTSQLGLVRLTDLRVVAPPPTETHNEATVETAAAPPPSPQHAETPTAPVAPPAALAAAVPVDATAASGASDDIFAKLEKLADLHAKGILSAEEFQAKKAELLSRV